MDRDAMLNEAVRRAIPANLRAKILEDAQLHGWGMTEAIWHGFVLLVRRNFLKLLSGAAA